MQKVCWGDQSRTFSDTRENPSLYSTFFFSQISSQDTAILAYICGKCLTPFDIISIVRRMMPSMGIRSEPHPDSYGTVIEWRVGSMTPKVADSMHVFFSLRPSFPGLSSLPIRYLAEAQARCGGCLSTGQDPPSACLSGDDVVFIYLALGLTVWFNGIPYVRVR